MTNHSRAVDDFGPLQPWQTSAINLAEHADNPVHTDEGAKAAGFAAALVAGTTVHAYLTHPPAAAWGAAWLDGGWSELRLLAPVFDEDTVDIVPRTNSVVEAAVDGQLRATLAVATTAPAPTPTVQRKARLFLMAVLAESLTARPWVCLLLLDEYALVANAR